MTMAIARQRNSPAMFIIRITQAVSTIVPVLLAWLSIRTRWPVVLGVPVDAVVVMVSAIAVISLVVDWWMTRFATGPTGVDFEKGLLFRRSTALAWPEITSVQVSRSPTCRIWGCARVTIGIGPESKSNLVIDAVSNATATIIENQFNSRRELPLASSKQEDFEGITNDDGKRALLKGPFAETPYAGELIYRIRVRDYFMLSFTYGQFVLVIPFALGLYENISEVISLPSILPNFSLQTISFPMFVVTALLLGIPVAIGFGMLVAWLRYRSFEVRLRAGVLEMSGGLVSTDSRLVSDDQVRGLKIAQNPLMRLTGHARLGFVSRQSGERLSANVLFPAVRLPLLRNGIRAHFPSYASVVNRSCTIGHPLAWSLVCFDAAVLVIAGVVFGRMPVATSIVLLVGLAMVLLVVTNYCWAAARMDSDNDVFVFRRGFIWVKYYVLSCDSVYFVESHRFGFSGRLSAMILCLGVYDSRAIRLWVPGSSAELLEQFIQAKSGTSLISKKSSSATWSFSLALAASR